MSELVDGPQITHGVGFVVDAEGVATRALRPAVAICRCEGSARRPWCDGTHKRLLAAAARRAERSNRPSQQEGAIT